MIKKIDNLALVLAGGGGRGAYQIGVWKYLKEVGIDKKISAITGTSVGALNACLIAQDDYHLAEHIWTNEIKDKILKTDAKIISSIVQEIDKSLLKKQNPLMSLPAIISLLQVNGAFSREGLLQIIDKYVDLEKITLNEKPIFATCVSLANFKPHYFKLNTYEPQKIKSILCATSAIPFVFPPEPIDGIEYVDGGIQKIGDNIPIKILYEQGYKNILVVHLDTKARIDKAKFPNANIIEIRPEKSLGNAITGILDFSANGAKQRIELGYADAKRVILLYKSEISAKNKNFYCKKEFSMVQ